ncbi:MAG: hypothetical protein U1D65_12845 [Pseudomonas sp.]|nr:hypothetical protein [Pseudomonas sp.]MDZ4192888.1 hypothetical protein [Pseudomonas sp.]
MSIEWNGEGLPPVGLECEVQNPMDGSWCECKILVHEGQVAVFRADRNYPWVYDGADAGAFRLLQEKQP